jgi:hypothetical protein
MNDAMLYGENGARKNLTPRLFDGVESRRIATVRTNATGREASRQATPHHRILLGCRFIGRGVSVNGLVADMLRMDLASCMHLLITVVRAPARPSYD